MVALLPFDSNGTKICQNYYFEQIDLEKKFFMVY